MSVCLHSFSRMVGAIIFWYSYTWTLTFNGRRGSRATCCLKKLILSLSKCILDTGLVWLVMDLHKLIMCIHVSIEHIGKTTVVWGHLWFTFRWLNISKKYTTTTPCTRASRVFSLVYLTNEYSDFWILIPIAILQAKIRGWVAQWVVCLFCNLSVLNSSLCCCCFDCFWWY